jgi:hypothetical protein
LRLKAYAELEIAVPMTLRTYPPYVLSETGVEWAISRGVPETEIRTWCQSTTKGFWIGAVLLVGYGVSIYLLNSLAGKGRPRRLGSWTFSIAFHGLMLALGATVGGLGRTIALFMAPEVVVVALSIVGLIMSAGRPGDAAPNSSLPPMPRRG